MSYKQEGGKVAGELPQKNIDTGAGLERIAMVMQGKDNVFETDLFASAMEKVKGLAEDFDEPKARIIVDHLRSSMFIISDGVEPSNTERGYILRRLLRRAILTADQLGIPENSFGEVIQELAGKYDEVYTNLDFQKIRSIVNDEEVRFRKTLEKGLAKGDRVPPALGAKGDRRRLHHHLDRGR